MNNQSRLMNRKMSVLVIIALMFSLTSTPVSAEAAVQVEPMADIILDNTTCSPMESIVVNNLEARYSYHDGLRISSSYGDSCKHFYYADERLTGQTDGENEISFQYCADKLVGMTLNDSVYTYAFDSIGSVVALKNSIGETICRYEYVKTLAIINRCSDNSDDILAGEINPFRYKGWYYDIETSLYYMGNGVFYDPQKEEYVHNTFVVNLPKGTPPILQAIADAYVGAINSQSFGATLYLSPSEDDWNSGSRWYSSVGLVELVARCVFAENPYANRQNDRKAVGWVIRNRVDHGFAYSGSNDARGIITFPSAFSTINPGTYAASVSKTAQARAVQNKNDSGFQLATLIGCTLYYSTDSWVYTSMVGNVSYITTNHTHFMSVNSAYTGTSFTVTNPGNNCQWKNGSDNVYGVCIAGVANLLSKTGSGTTCLQTYYNDGYNVFYKYSST